MPILFAVYKIQIDRCRAGGIARRNTRDTAEIMRAKLDWKDAFVENEKRLFLFFFFSYQLTSISSTYIII